MKSFLICILLCGSITAQCQEFPKNLLDSILKNNKIDSVKTGNLPLMYTVEKNRTRTGSTKYGIVYALPVDNMPCIVPNMEDYTTMPNTGNKLILEIPIDPGIYSKPFSPFSRIIPLKKTHSLKFRSR